MRTLSWVSCGALLALATALAPVPGAAPARGGQEQQGDAPPPDWRAREAELLARIATLEAELAAERERRMEREREWLEFTRAIASLDATRAPRAPEFLGPIEEVAGSEDAGDAAAAARTQLEAREAEEERRAEELRVELRAHLLADQVLSLDVLQVGRLHDGWVGPVVLRTLDERGRALGTLVAERLRLEGSRSGHSVSLVLEEGYERIGGERIPFEGVRAVTTEGTEGTEPEGTARGGVRRIHLPGVDPRPWIASFPDLFTPDALVETPDDGRYDRLALRMTLDALLRAAPRTGHWRLPALGGVLGDELRDVQIAELDTNGGIVRRLFADRMRVRRNGSGIELVLLDGVQVRGGRKVPFLQGAYRIFLLDADAQAWHGAGIPGL